MTATERGAAIVLVPGAWMGAWSWADMDPAAMTRPVTEQDVTFVATALPGTDPYADLPPEVTGTMPNRWRLRGLTSGHWPMLSAPDALQAVLEEEAVRA